MKFVHKDKNFNFNLQAMGTSQDFYTGVDKVPKGTLMVAVVMKSC